MRIVGLAILFLTGVATSTATCPRSDLSHVARPDIEHFYWGVLGVEGQTKDVQTERLVDVLLMGLDCERRLGSLRCHGQSVNATCEQIKAIILTTDGVSGRGNELMHVATRTLFMGVAMERVLCARMRQTAESGAMMQKRSSDLFYIMFPAYINDIFLRHMGKLSYLWKPALMRAWVWQGCPPHVAFVKRRQTCLEIGRHFSPEMDACHITQNIVSHLIQGHRVLAKHQHTCNMYYVEDIFKTFGRASIDEPYTWTLDKNGLGDILKNLTSPYLPLPLPPRNATRRPEHTDNNHRLTRSQYSFCGEEFGPDRAGEESTTTTASSGPVSLRDKMASSGPVSSRDKTTSPGPVSSRDKTTSLEPVSSRDETTSPGPVSAGSKLETPWPETSSVPSTTENMSSSPQISDLESNTLHPTSSNPSFHDGSLPTGSDRHRRKDRLIPPGHDVPHGAKNPSRMPEAANGLSAMAAAQQAHSSNRNNRKDNGPKKTGRTHDNDSSRNQQRSKGSIPSLGDSGQMLGLLLERRGAVFKRQAESDREMTMGDWQQHATNSNDRLNEEWPAVLLIEMVTGRSDDTLDIQQFYELCPILLHHLLFDVNLPAKPTLVSFSPDETKGTTAEMYGYGTLSVLVISLCAGLGAVFFRAATAASRNYVMAFLLALAVGSLCGDAGLRLVPEVTVESAKIQMGSLKIMLMLAGIYVFILLEMLMDIYHRHEHDKEQITITAIQVPKKKALTRLMFGSARHIQANNPQPTSMELAIRSPDPSSPPSVPVEESVQTVKVTVKKKLDHKYLQGSMVLAWMVVVGDSIHNFADGLEIGAAYRTTLANGLSASVAVFCHELAHELGDFAILVSTGMSLKKAILLNLGSAATAFVGLYVGLGPGLGPGLGTGPHRGATQLMQALALGMFMCLALAKLVPELMKYFQKHRNVKMFICQNVGILTGYAVMVIIAIYKDSSST